MGAGVGLLHVEASPRGGRSRSSAVARRLIGALAPVEVETLNLFDADLPPLDGSTIEGRYALIAGERVAPDVVAEWAAIEALTISCPSTAGSSACRCGISAFPTGSNTMSIC